MPRKIPFLKSKAKNKIFFHFYVLLVIHIYYILLSNNGNNHYILCFKNIGVYKMAGTENDNKMQIIPTLTTRLKVVQKRSGESVPFDAKKIFDAVKKAVAVTHEISDEQIVAITQSALNKLESKFTEKNPTVEDVQESVIESLMDARAYKTAESYIIYRQKRSEIRDSYVDAVEIIEGYVGGSKWRIKENAKIGYSIGGLILRTS